MCDKAQATKSCFLLIDWLSFGEDGEGGEEGKGAGFGSKLDVQGQDGGRLSDIDGQGVGGLENWTIFMDVI